MEAHRTHEKNSVHYLPLLSSSVWGFRTDTLVKWHYDYFTYWWRTLQRLGKMVTKFHILWLCLQNSREFGHSCFRWSVTRRQTYPACLNYVDFLQIYTITDSLKPEQSPDSPSFQAFGTCSGWVLSWRVTKGLNWQSLEPLGELRPRPESALAFYRCPEFPRKLPPVVE